MDNQQDQIPDQCKTDNFAQQNNNSKRVRLNELQQKQQDSQINDSLIFHPKIEDEQIDQIKKKGFKELKHFIGKYKGSLPVFGYPLISFQEQIQNEDTSVTQQLWDSIKESVMVNAGNDELPDESQEQEIEIEQQSLMVKILDKYEKEVEKDNNLLKAFTEGRKINSRERSRALNNDFKRSNTFNNNDNYASSNPNKGSNTLPTYFAGNSNMSNASQSFGNQDFTNQAANATQKSAFLKNQFNQSTNSKIKSKKEIDQEGQKFMQFIKGIKRNAAVSREKLTQMYVNQYKVYNLSKDGQQEMDFEDWASDIKRNHPIAKAYQDLRKNHFDRLRRKLNQQQQSTEYSSPSTSTLNVSRNKNMKQAKSLTISYQKNQDIQSNYSRNINKTPQHLFKNSSIKDQTSEYKNQQKSQSRFAFALNSSVINSTHESGRFFNTTNEYNDSQDNTYYKNYKVSKSNLLSQVRKHLYLVKHANQYENTFTDATLQFQTKNPLNAYYQLSMNTDYSFRPEQVLNPASMQDFQELRDNYKDSCFADFRISGFENTAFQQYKAPYQTSYSGKRANSIQTMYTTINGDVNHSQLTSKSQFTQQKLSTIQLENKENTINIKPKGILATRPKSLIPHRRKSDNIYNNKGQNSMFESINDKDNKEPEMPLTGYNYKKYQNECKILMNVAESGDRLRQLRNQMDKQIHSKVSEEQHNKYSKFNNKARESIIQKNIELFHKQ